MSDNKRRRAAKEEDELMQTTDISDEQVEMLKSLELGKHLTLGVWVCPYELTESQLACRYETGNHY